jgi:circadian clock protein KaiB
LAILDGPARGAKAAIARHVGFDIVPPARTPRLSKFLLKLYITGTSARAEIAIANLKRICEEDLGGAYQLEIIDVLEHPEAAETDRIVATPTLVKQLPPPLRRVIGDLSDRDKVLLGLEVLQHDRPPTRQS